MVVLKYNREWLVRYQMHSVSPSIMLLSTIAKRDPGT